MAWSLWNCGSREGAGRNQGISVLGGTWYSEECAYDTWKEQEPGDMEV